MHDDHFMHILIKNTIQFLRHIPEPPLPKFPLRFGENFPADMYNIVINLLYLRSVISIRVFHACTGRIDMVREAN